ncbi:MAG TPA: hypothetical protein VFX59_14580 [Polyangiales bacterium]|nr:hypothetical protein [Polyangiales bacterium]
MSKVRWAALVALALPACATAGQTAFNHPAGQAAQPGSWQTTQAQAHADFVKHDGPRGQAEQPYAWVGSQPVYPRDQHRLAQDGQTYAGGRAGQPGSWTPSEVNTWALQIAQNDSTKAKQ